MFSVLQGIDAGFNIVVLVGATVIFLFTLEARWKRQQALGDLDELRSIIHVIDMHQLTKDPDRMLGSDPAEDTPSSPARTMTVFELTRYLDYCSEMLSLLSKSAAIYAQDFDDPVTISAVNEIESLTSGLSRKIWQKIMVLGTRH